MRPLELIVRVRTLDPLGEAEGTVVVPVGGETRPGEEQSIKNMPKTATTTRTFTPEPSDPEHATTTPRCDSPNRYRFLPSRCGRGSAGREPRPGPLGFEDIDPGLMSLINAAPGAGPQGQDGSLQPKVASDRGSEDPAAPV